MIPPDIEPPRRCKYCNQSLDPTNPTEFCEPENPVEEMSDLSSYFNAEDCERKWQQRDRLERRRGKPLKDRIDWLERQWQIVHPTATPDCDYEITAGSPGNDDYSEWEEYRPEPHWQDMYCDTEQPDDFLDEILDAFFSYSTVFVGFYCDRCGQLDCRCEP